MNKKQISTWIETHPCPENISDEEYEIRRTKIIAIGRFLNCWDLIKGCPFSLPDTKVFEYKKGDYYYLMNEPELSSDGMFRRIVAPYGSCYEKGGSNTVITFIAASFHPNVAIYDGEKFFLDEKFS